MPQNKTQNDLTDFPEKTAERSSGFKRPLGLVCSPSDLSFVEDIVTRSGTSFAKGMCILEPARREAMFAIYAFCRLVDDIADGDTDDTSPKEALEEWRKIIERLYHGEAHNALERVLGASIERFHLQKEDFLAVIDGMEMDCGAPMIAPSEAVLDLYCDRVASAVGRLSVCVFGLRGEKGQNLARHLGRGLQLTNILRDIAEDAERGRLYLPKELLTRFDVPEKPSEISYYRGLDDLCRVLAYRVRDHFREAEKIMAQCPGRLVRPAAMMAASYRVVLEALERRGWIFPEKPLHISPLKKKFRLFLAYIGIGL